MRLSRLAPILLAMPLGLILSVFLLVPMIVLIMVSFFDYDSVQIIPAFIFTNYHDVLSSSVTWETYLNTLRYTVIVWAVTVVLITPLLTMPVTSTLSPFLSTIESWEFLRYPRRPRNTGTPSMSASKFRIQATWSSKSA